MKQPKLGPQEPPDDPRIFNRRQPDGSFKPMAEFFAVEMESVPWCSKFDHAIDYELIKGQKPACSRTRNGCYGCEDQYQKRTMTGKAKP